MPGIRLLAARKILRRLECQVYNNLENWICYGVSELWRLSTNAVSKNFPIEGHGISKRIVDYIIAVSPDLNEPSSYYLDDTVTTGVTPNVSNDEKYHW